MTPSEIDWLKQTGRAFQEDYSALKDWILANPRPGAASSATAILSSAQVGEGGRRQRGGAGVRICLMNVLRWSPTDFATRAALLESVLRGLQLSGPTVLLAPAGYFGWDTVDISQQRLGQALPARFDREQVLAYLERAIPLPENLLLVLGLDWPAEQSICFVERGRVRRFVRDHGALDERIYPFGGLSLLGLVCGEIQQRKDEVLNCVQAHGIDAVLCAAHVEVRGTVNEGRDPRRFPFETAMNRISAAGAAAFLSHHHPDQLWPGTPFPKSHSYNSWGVFAGSGADEDWMGWDAEKGEFAHEQDFTTRISLER